MRSFLIGFDESGPVRCWNAAVRNVLETPEPPLG